MRTTTIVCDFCGEEIFGSPYIVRVEELGPGVEHKPKKYDLHKECAESVQYFIESKSGKKLEEVLWWCQELGIKHVTIYAFSTENFNRSSEEVKMLMGLFAEKFKKVVKDERIHKYKIRVRAIGDLSCLPEQVKEAIEEAQKATRGYDGYTLNIAAAYGGRAELAEAVRRICERIKRNELKPSDVDESIINSHLYTAGLPDPDLIIRTSGEERLSGFLLWQSAYSELYFCEANWPEFNKIEFLRAIRTYQGRKRRLGK